MKRHLYKNSELFFIAVEEIIIGFLIILQSTQFRHILPPPLNWTNSFFAGMIYLVLGVALMMNSIWDFYWYRIRIVLLGLSELMWVLISVSYTFDMIEQKVVEPLPLFFFVIAARIIMIAAKEPAYKMKGGGDD